jgi:DNA replication protein DnaC
MDEMILLKAKLNKLKLPKLLETLQERLKQAIKEKWSYSQFLDILLTDEMDRRNQSQFSKKLVKSHLQVNKTLETFDFSFNTKIYEPILKELATCHFVENKECVLIIGPSGVGKSHLAQSIGHEAIRKGYEVLFYRTYQLFYWISMGHGDGSYRKRLQQVIKVPLLILDDFGLQSLSEASQMDLYEVICERYEKAATIITSNREFGEWQEIFANPLIGSAALDRLIHRATKLVIEGKSYRMEQFNKRSKKQNKETGK